jgi:hypothetical protein
MMAKCRVKEVKDRSEHSGGESHLKSRVQNGKGT